jgi:hypothetical protein
MEDLNWPFSEFPQDASTWEACREDVRRMRDALEQIRSRADSDGDLRWALRQIHDLASFGLTHTEERTSIGK